MMHSPIAAFTIVLAAAQLAGAALRTIDSDLKPVDGKSVAVYKITPQGELKINLYFPKDWKPSDQRAGIVFFFGGGFTNGTPSQFTTKAEYLAGRGMVAGSAEYRIKSVHHTEPDKCIEDAKSAVRWLRVNAKRLGIDPNKVLAGGGSAGGTDAVFTAYNTTFEPEGEDQSVSSKPNALVLYNPAIGTKEYKGNEKRSAEDNRKMATFLSAWKVAGGGPPAILFFGTEDALLIPARTFVKQMAAAGNRVELYTAEGEKHGFFNDRPGTPWHASCLRQTDLFLTSLGYLKGSPAIEAPAGGALKKELP
ncbi:MAG TPA: alpha/beta hydrolase [Bryobacteraceae bacterium]|nr:alpha/beta hydrolase [Bryobacteraceae bacterium]